MNTLSVVKGQEVAVFSNLGTFQGFYHVESVSPKGTKIVVKREDGYTRTFNSNNIEQNGYSHKYRTDYIRTDVDVVRQDLSNQQHALTIITSLQTVKNAIPDNLSKYVDQESLQSIAVNLQKRLTETQDLLNTLYK